MVDTKKTLESINFNAADVVNGITTIGSLIGNFVPYVGPAATAFRVIFKFLNGDKDQSDLDQLKPSFDRLHQRFDQVDDKLNQLMTEFKKHGYTLRQEKVMIDLSARFDHFLAHPELDHPRHMFNTSCAKFPTFDLMSFINAKVVGQGLLINGPKEVADRRNLLVNFRDVTSVLIKTTILHAACFSAMNGHRMSEDQLKREYSADGARFGRIATRVEQAFTEADNFIVRNFMPPVRADVARFAERHSSMTNKDFANRLFGQLKSKYFWREWLVGSYSGSFSAKHDGETRSNSTIFELGKNGRSYFVSTPRDGQVANENCVNEKLVKGGFIRRILGGCPSNVNRVRGCVSTSSTILCVQDGSKLSYAGDTRSRGIHAEKVNGYLMFIVG